jgi:hypothetical protein
VAGVNKLPLQDAGYRIDFVLGTEEGEWGKRKRTSTKIETERERRMRLASSAEKSCVPPSHNRSKKESETCAKKYGEVGRYKAVGIFRSQLLATLGRQTINKRMQGGDVEISKPTGLNKLQINKGDSPFEAK